MGGAFFWVVRGGWENVLVVWRCVGASGDVWGWVGVRALFKITAIPTCSFKPTSKFLFTSKTCLLIWSPPYTLPLSPISPLILIIYKHPAYLSPQHLSLTDMCQNNLLGDNTTTFQGNMLQTQVQQTFPGTRQLKPCKAFPTNHYYEILKSSPWVSILAQHLELTHFNLLRNQLPVKPKPWKQFSILETLGTKCLSYSDPFILTHLSQNQPT